MQRPASLAAPYTASDPLFFLPSPLPHTSRCFLEEGVGFLGEEKGTIILFPHSWLIYWKDSHWKTVGGSWKEGSDLSDKKKKKGESFMSTCTRAHTHAQPRLNKHFKLAGQDRRLFSIWIAGEGRKIVQHSLFGLNFIEADSSERRVWDMRHK